MTGFLGEFFNPPTPEEEEELTREWEERLTEGAEPWEDDDEIIITDAGRAAFDEDNN